MPLPQSKTKRKHSWEFEAIGTRWSIETTHLLGDMQTELQDRIELFDRTYSRFREDSLVTAMSQQAGAYEFPEDAEQLVEFYRELYDATNGTVSPLVGNVLEAAGYDREYSLRSKKVVPAPPWDDVMHWDRGKVQTNRPLVLDFGAAGKGYLVDIVAEMLEQAGVVEYVIDASGDIRLHGSEQVIGLENPHDTTRVLGTVQVENASLCASAINRRAWGEWHHVVDPRTAAPVQGVVATWVVAPTTMVADGLATALFFVEPSQLAQWDFAYARLLQDGTIERSADFVGELYI